MTPDSQERDPYNIPEFDRVMRGLVGVDPEELKETAQMSDQSSNEAKAAKLKSRIDELREEWERLDANGSQSTKQNSVSNRIGIVQKQLKELTGEDY
ncbi:MAG: hypothetical protein H6822_26640 [Planctomycetaceae bacterium]|nr:hypothetical protein [Planctomycetales bacterium]MCB9925757.1 hypothetical protein [Planctomycetaceae bacterium]